MNKYAIQMDAYKLAQLMQEKAAIDDNDIDAYERKVSIQQQIDEIQDNYINNLKYQNNN